MDETIPPPVPLNEEESMNEEAVAIEDDSSIDETSALGESKEEIADLNAEITTSVPSEPFVKPPLKRMTMSRGDSERPIRKELITMFVACTSLNLPSLPQTFFQSVFKKKKAESLIPEVRIEVEMRRPTDTLVVHYQATEPRRSKNPSFTIGFTIPIPLSTKTPKAIHGTYCLYFRVMQTDVGMEKVVAQAEVTCSMLMENFRQGSPVVHLPLEMAGSKEAILSLTFGRVFPVKHSVVPTQNMLLHMYSLNPEQDAKDIPSKKTLVATEEVLEVGYHTAVPPVFLHQAYKEIEAVHRLWKTRYNNARKKDLDFDTPEEALANGCDVYAIEVISGRGLKLPPNLPVVTPARTSRSSASGSNGADPSAITLNPFVMVKFREMAKGKRAIEVSEGKTNVEMNTSEPNWCANFVVDKPKSDKKESKSKNQCFEFYRPSPVSVDGHTNSALERILQFDVASECVSHFDGQIDIGQVLIPVKAILYEGSNDTYAINVTKWLPVLSSTGENRGEILIRIQLRRTTMPYVLESEDIPGVNGTLLKLADPVRERIWQSKLSSQDPLKPLNTAELRDQVASLEFSLKELSLWINYIQDHSSEWFRSSQDKTRREVQPLATNLHVAYFRLFKGMEPSRGTILQRDVEEAIVPGQDISAFLSRLDSTSLDDIAVLELQDMLEVDATYSTVTCGAPTAHGLGLSKTGLIEMEEALMQCDKGMERMKVEYALRKSVCLSQSLSVLVTTFMTQLELCLQRMVPQPDLIMEQWAAVGFLIGWESLVSTQGKELHMLSDAWIAIKSLERFAIRLVSGDALELHEREDGYVLDLPIPSVHFGSLPVSLQEGKLISITAVLFTQGINEMQTLANAVGAVGIELQSRINEKSLKALQKYQLNVTGSSRFMEKCASLKLDPLAALISSTEKKNTRILLEASDDVRRLNGGRVTFCKSGKDRTAMSVTLDQARILGGTWKQSTMLMKESTMDKEWLEIKPIANFMREYGVRIEVAKKNVGQARYSFNALQRKCLPKIYRPSAAAIQGSHDVDDS
ncbi:inositol-3,4-bisphosphate 4-phosphatase [Thraustotheca clavata]|uniref:phosphatidylinositol-3,4-bisphosphate 4-phosphatase n=1 Tax=Thraustotheca clavata TaxID=74557 RepID=A0A1V9Y6T0_9STRA|nr:inositol-3,4-bisphosphate 4-phosphatase [Thraustotheca clavata]